MRRRWNESDSIDAEEVEKGMIRGLLTKGEVTTGMTIDMSADMFLPFDILEDHVNETATGIVVISNIIEKDTTLAKAIEAIVTVVAIGEIDMKVAIKRVALETTTTIGIVGMIDIIMIEEATEIAVGTGMSRNVVDTE